MKTRLLIMMLGFFLAMPGFTSANLQTPDNSEKQGEKSTVPGSQDKAEDKESEECDCEKQEHSHKNWQAKMAEREQNLLAWVDQYTPEKKSEWTKVLAEKKELRNKWLSPENAQKREKWKQEKMAKIQELKKQLDAGKITKEEFVQKAHGGKAMGNWKTYHDLKVAVETKNDQQAAALLNQLLEQSKQHNEKIKAMLAE
ncbi:hypothetical protein P9D43_04075 [Neobacillus niacini]|uniref:hypothetical protein n=1 Tax=Neobacillus niacini TaxID=86668 RepID=UPI0007AB5AD9|nr:hypothetical protein [Neobacillus niacini]MEC1521217.1 hypothetical protein [Neobacillus niacini]